MSFSFRPFASGRRPPLVSSGYRGAQGKGRSLSISWSQTRRAVKVSREDVALEGPRPRPRAELEPARRDGASGAKMRRRLGRLGTALIVVGVVVLAYAASVLLWRDPATDVYARWKQGQLAGEFETMVAEYRKKAPATPPRAEPRREAVAAVARRFQATLELGQPLGRIAIPKLGRDDVFLHGTRWRQDLSRGPGHYPETSVPGLGKTVAIAGHRTTFGAPFRHIDELKKGDSIRLELPYGTFAYRVFGREIVDSDDWSVIRQRGFETLVLSACHPLYSSSQRIIVYGRLVRVRPPVAARAA